MEERKRDPKREQEDKIRCANYLLDMFIKYGPEILTRKEKKEKEEAEKAAQSHMEKE